MKAAILPSAKKAKKSPASEELKQSFTDRLQDIEAFNRLAQLSKQSNYLAVLAFHGINGIGKSSLLSYLYKDAQEHAGAQPHGYARIRFNRGQHGTETPQVFWELREQLQASVKERLFERFDLFWGAWWERTNNTSIEDNQDLSGKNFRWRSIISSAAEFTGSIIPVPIIALLLKKLVDWGTRAFGSLRHRAVVTKISIWFEHDPKAPKGDSLKTFLKTAKTAKLVEWLPRCFAADLADAALARPVTIFIDGYEILEAQTHQQFGRGTATFIQIFAEELARINARVLLVIGGANPLRWAEGRRSDGTSVWKSAIEQYQLTNFSEADALAYLERRQVPADQARTIYQTLGGYPLALSIAADLLEIGSRRNTGDLDLAKELDLANLRGHVSGFEPLSSEWRAQVEEWLLNKLLDQLDANGQNNLRSLVRLAAIPRWFNEELLLALADTYTFQDDFQQLTGYSFVKPIPGQPGWWQLDWHARKFLLDTTHSPDQRRTWEKKACEWFKDQASQSTGKQRQAYRLEALYHLWQINPTQAADTIDEYSQNPEMSQLEFRWNLLNTASETETSLPPDIQFRLLLHKAQLHLLTFSQLDRPGANKELALLNADAAFRLVDDAHLGDDARGKAYLAKAEVLNLLQRFSEATGEAVQACEAAQQADDKLTLAKGLRLRAILETNDNPDFGNMALIEEARTLLASLKDSPSHQAGTVTAHNLGAAIAHDFRWDQATLALRFQLWEELEAILSDIEREEQDPYRKAAIEQYYGEAYTQQGKWEAAIPHLKRAHWLSQELDYTIGMCAAIGWWGIALCAGGQDDQGLPKIHEAFSLECDTLASREGVAKWFLHLGREVYQQRGRLDLALDCFLRAQILYADINHVLAQRAGKYIDDIRAMIGEEEFARLRDEFDPERGEFAPYYLRCKNNFPLS